MLIRAVIVLLVVLNLGVAAWWISRSEMPRAEPPAMPAGVATLELVKPTAPATTPPGPAPASISPTLCLRLGPFPDQSSAEQASTRLGSAIVQARAQSLPAEGASAYSVLLPPAESRDAAQATAQRIAAAGFTDMLVVNDGVDANAIALGRYRNRGTALRRQAELAAAGFPAEVRAAGRGASTQWWLDVSAGPAVTAADLQARTGAARAETQSCDDAVR